MKILRQKNQIKSKINKNFKKTTKQRLTKKIRNQTIYLIIWKILID